MKALLASLFLIFSIQAFSEECKLYLFPEYTDTSKKIVIGDITFSGNKRTRTPYIEREIGFKKGDTLNMAELDDRLQTTHNELFNTNLFNQVILSPQFSEDSSRMDLAIEVEESWQLFIIPRIKFADRNINAWLKSDEPDKFSRIYYGFSVKMGNFTGRREQLIVSIMAGYDYVGNIQYLLPFINKKKTWGILFEVNYNFSKETNYGTGDDLALFYKDSTIFSRKEFTAKAGIRYQKNLFTVHQFKILYNDFLYIDTIYRINPNFSQEPFQSQQNLGFQYLLTVDHRNYIAYPTDGYYFDLEFTKLGLNLFDEYPNLYTIRSTYRQYWELGRRWYAGAALNVYGCTDPQYPFYLQYGLGYDRFYVRGYENYLIKTQFYALFKSNIKYALLPEKVYHLSFIPFRKFNKIPLSIYGNLFIDMAWSYDKQFSTGNSLPNTGLLGYGIGFDISSYYQRVFRIEFTANKDKETGIYFSFIAPL